MKLLLTLLILVLIIARISAQCKNANFECLKNKCPDIVELEQGIIITSGLAQQVLKQQLEDRKCFEGFCCPSQESQMPDDVCGRQVLPSTTRIQVIGSADNNPPGTWPWMGSLGYYTSSWIHVCGSSLISKSFALTAAHCIPRRQNEDRFIRFGESNLTRNAQSSTHISKVSLR